MNLLRYRIDRHINKFRAEPTYWLAHYTLVLYRYDRAVVVRRFLTKPVDVFSGVYVDPRDRRWVDQVWRDGVIGVGQTFV